MGNFFDELREIIAPIKDGFKITGKHMLRHPVTYEYPEERRPMPDRSRWRHILRRYTADQPGVPADFVGLERCIGCALCAAACPSHCIFVQAGENTEELRFSPGERYAEIYQINLLRCIFCGMCEEACPTGAIVLTNDFELAEYTREDFIYNKERLLVPPVS